jgi:hypothetical protein
MTIIMELDLIVIRAAYMIPSRLAIRGPIPKRRSPSNVKGITIQKRKISRFTIRSLDKIILNDSLAEHVTIIESNRANKRAGKRLEMATIIEKAQATTIRPLGSRRCIIESPMVKFSSNN